ncbi:MAG: YabP/YqfC family sporulation protein [Gemmiger sp.]|uniref:YabP/YqfC family sporulation protein n=1 Tax=Gemmiger sp. TaxID=2049027 RepID=UPI002E79C6BE|nr:YabP/YqfC family sporulation protein [Gemmiger sp.]MEE0801434.1 YabP/YqfC family sporulation protein [Gemmiger sp.]
MPELHVQETAALPARAHVLTLENRTTLTMTGVTRVIGCDENGATLQTPLGDLTVGGREIQVSELSVHTGEVHISGKIEFLQYSENRQSRPAGSFWSRLLH